MVSTDPWILNTVRYGYCLDFVAQPVQSKPPIPLQMSDDMLYVCNNEIRELLSKGAVHSIPQTEEGFFSTIFVVPKRQTGLRPVFNLKSLNSFIRYEHFQMESMEDVRQLLQPGDFLAKIDLKDAYFTVPVNEAYWQFLRLNWGGRDIRICLLALWSELGTSRVYEADETRDGLFTITRHSIGYLYRRYSDNGVKCAGGRIGGRIHLQFANLFGIHR